VPAISDFKLEDVSFSIPIASRIATSSSTPAVLSRLNSVPAWTSGVCDGLTPVRLKRGRAALQRDPLQSLVPEQRELQRETIVRVVELRARELPDTT
jgi:hypothetical protein